MSRLTLDPSARRSRGGHTLWEMLLVIALLGTIGALVAPASPALRGEKHDDGVTHAARELSADFAAARLMALDRAETVRVVLDPAGGHLWLFVTDRGAMRLVAERDLALPADVALVASEPRVTIWFSPDGTSSGGTVLLRGDTRQRLLTVDRWTGVANAE